MAKLRIKQKERISEMQGNIAVAWYAAGVISPFFLKEKDATSFIISIITGFVMFRIYYNLSLKMLAR